MENDKVFNLEKLNKYDDEKLFKIIINSDWNVVNDFIYYIGNKVVDCINCNSQESTSEVDSNNEELDFINRIINILESHEYYFLLGFLCYVIAKKLKQKNLSCDLLLNKFPFFKTSNIFYSFLTQIW